jgi:hypothetical protein
VDISLSNRQELGRIIERLQDENTALRAANVQLQAMVVQLTAEVRRLTEQVEKIEAELAQRGSGGSAPGEGPPAWVKSNKPARTGPKKPRKKRARGFARKRGSATATVRHALASCPDCGCSLAGGSVKRHREVIEISIAPAVVTDHQLIERVCPVCAKRCVPTLGRADGVVGRHRFGPQLLGLIATLHEQGRMTVEGIHEHLATVYALEVSVGGIDGALHAVAARGARQVAAIRDEVRQSAVVCADETTWREDGLNLYAWLLATPTACYFELGRRTGEKIDALLGTDFSGILIVDFYAAYDHFSGDKQRCWAHLLRDARDLRAQFRDDRLLACWVRRLQRIYRAARDHPGSTLTERRANRRRIEAMLLRVCAPFSQGQALQRTLCQRIQKHINELFVAVDHPGVPLTNNRAERAIRPLVIARKISGGTRSDRGSTDAMRRATLFHT